MPEPGLQTRPGQYIQRREGGPGEFREVLQWVMALWLVRMATAVAVAWAVFVLGPRHVGIVVALGAALVVMIARDREEDPLPDSVAVVLLVLLALVTAAWVAAGGELLETIWPVPWGFRPYRIIWYWQLALLVPSLAWLSLGSVVDYRLTYELTDPNWPPPVKARESWVGPGGPGRLFDVPPEGVSPEREPVGTVPRPVRYGDEGAYRLSPVEIEAALNGRLGMGSRSENAGRALETVRVATADGETVRYGDLVRFVRQIPVRGAAYGNWGDLWDHEYWGRIVDVCSVFGIVSKRAERQKTRVLIEDWRVSVRLLSQLLA